MKAVDKPVEELSFDPKVIAQAVIKIADATKALYASGLNEKAIVTLISDSSKIPKRTVQDVLYHMYHLKDTYLMQPKAK